MQTSYGYDTNGSMRRNGGAEKYNRKARKHMKHEAKFYEGYVEFLEEIRKELTEEEHE